MYATLIGQIVTRCWAIGGGTNSGVGKLVEGVVNPLIHPLLGVEWELEKVASSGRFSVIFSKLCAGVHWHGD